MILELVPRDDLIEELARRYPNMVIGLHAPLASAVSNRLVWFQGEPMVALGLTRILEYEMLTHIKASEVIDPEQTDQREPS